MHGTTESATTTTDRRLDRRLASSVLQGIGIQGLGHLGLGRLGMNRLGVNRVGACIIAMGVGLFGLGCTSQDGSQLSGDSGGGSSDSLHSTTEPTVIDVWLDVDPAIGLPESEVDDGVMMVQAFHSPELLIRGVSVVFGNTARDNGLPIARELVERFGPAGLDVFSGAGSEEELGLANDAVGAMAAALERSPMHILAVGPVTNVGSLLRLHPSLAPRIKSIVMVAARRVGQHFRATPESSGPPFRDFNFELDAEAMQVILDSDVPLVFAPWEVSSHVWITDEDLAQIGERSASGQWIKENVASWIEQWKTNLGTDGFNPFDTLAVAWMTHPELIENFQAGVWIQEDADDVQPGKTKPYLYVDPDRREGRQATYLFRPHAAVKEILLDRLVGPVALDETVVGSDLAEGK